MKSLLILALLVLSGIAVKTHTLKNIVEDSVSETGNIYDQAKENFLNFLPVPDKSEKYFSAEEANEHTRKKRTLLSAAVVGVQQALRRQQIRRQNKLERTRLRNERYKLRNDLRLKKLNDSNQKIKAQLDQWDINQQLSRQRHEQRWMEINKQLTSAMNFQPNTPTQNNLKQYFQYYPPMNFQDSLNTQNTMNKQYFPPLNFKQHQMPNKIPQSLVSTLKTLQIQSTTPIG